MATVSKETKAVLEQALARFDAARARRKGYNRYALGHYLHRLDEACEDAATGLSIASAIRRNFTDQVRDALLKAIGEPI